MEAIGLPICYLIALIGVSYILRNSYFSRSQLWLYVLLPSNVLPDVDLLWNFLGVLLLTHCYKYSCPIYTFEVYHIAYYNNI